MDLEVVNMLDWLTGGDDDSDESSESPGDDLLGDAEWEEEGDMGDEVGFDEMEADDEDDGQVDELAHQVDEFEQELDSVSSTVNTIRHETEEFGEDLEDIKDNVRQLLEIYEMVTRGVNPFSDDQSFQQGGSGAGAFDLFGDEEGDSVAPEDAGGDEMLEDDFDDDAFDEFDEPSDLDEGGRSFDDLKEEYEGEEMELEPEEEEPFLDMDDDELDESAEDEAEVLDDEVSSEPDSSSEEPTSKERAEHSDVLGEKPYLSAIPDGYASDLLVMQWMNELRERGNPAAVADTIEYYQEIGWINREVADELHSFIPGIADIQATEEPVAVSSLPFEDHRRSLWYVHQLATASPRRMVLTDAPEDLETLLSVDSNGLDKYDSPRPTARTDGGDSDIDRIDMTEHDPSQEGTR